MNYTLLVEFKSPNERILYDGPANVSGTLSDHLRISENRIVLTFSRSRRVDPSQMLYTAKSNYRKYLQQALCFLLALTGKLPPLIDITLEDKQCTYNIKNSHFTDIWANCNCDRLFYAKELSHIFSNKEPGKSIYIALSHWLKAELDPIRNDKFRALWSGFNALYNLIASDTNAKSERVKLIHFRKFFTNKHIFSNAVEYVQKQIPNSFWANIDLYQYATDRYLLHEDHYRLIELYNAYPDIELFQKLLRNIAALNKDQPSVIKQISQIRSLMSKTEIDYQARLLFLLTSYAYTYRNKYYHGEIEYPLFDMQAPNQVHEEAILCEVIRLSIVDIIKYLANK